MLKVSREAQHHAQLKVKGMMVEALWQCLNQLQKEPLGPLVEALAEADVIYSKHMTNHITV